MRFLTLASAALVLAACSGGDKSTGTPTGGTVPPTTECDSGEFFSDTADECVSAAPACLDPKTVFMDYNVAWDGTTTQGSMPDTEGNVFYSYFDVTIGPAGWTGDTSSPPNPDNWCFVSYDISGIGVGDTTAGEFAALNGFGAAITNCGQESSPGAGDAVTLCPGSIFDGYDPTTLTGNPADWTFDVGGHEISEENADIPAQFAPYGYVAENFWGGSIDNAFFPDEPFPILWYGLKSDDGTTLNGGPSTDFERYLASDHGPGTLLPGYYPSIIVWYVQYQ